MGTLMKDSPACNTKLSIPEPPGPIDNSRIAQVKGSGHIQLKQGESPRTH